MTTSILQRIHSLADKPPSVDACKAAASILRKLATDEGAVQKAHAITGTLAGFEPRRPDRDPRRGREAGHLTDRLPRHFAGCASPRRSLRRGTFTETDQ